MTPRRHALAAFAALALLLHAALLGGVDLSTGFAFHEPDESAMTVRTLPAPAATAPPAATAEIVAAAPPVPPAPAAIPPPAAPPPARRPARAASTPAAEASIETASAPRAADPAASTMPAVELAAATESAASAASSPVAEASATSLSAKDGAVMASSGSDPPPPLYRTLLPPAVTLRYEVRRGFLRGDGEIRWQPGGQAYTLELEARVGGIVLLTQTSTGSVGENGLMPLRFVDRRVRRSAQAANFNRDAGTITFSGPSTTLPLPGGAQDRLSLFIQLAGIAAAAPERLVDGATLAMAVVGARGDAAVWTLRVAGHENVDTAAGAVAAVKLVREARGPTDGGADIWLDPARHWLPVHATLRNANGASEYELLLEGMVSGP